MKATAKLIKKEKLKTNYKLTFNKGNNNFFLILHEKRRKIFQQLVNNCEYSFDWIKGKKYSFLCPFSIELSKQTSQPRTAKEFFINELSEELKTTKKNNDFHIEVEKFIQFLYIKHEKNLNVPFRLLSEIHQKEIRMLNKLKTLFLVDYIH